MCCMNPSFVFNVPDKVGLRGRYKYVMPNTVKISTNCTYSYPILAHPVSCTFKCVHATRSLTC